MAKQTKRTFLPLREGSRTSVIRSSKSHKNVHAWGDSMWRNDFSMEENRYSGMKLHWRDEVAEWHGIAIHAIEFSHAKTDNPTSPNSSWRHRFSTLTSQY